MVHIQAYSVRPGTAAARRPDDVPLVEKKRRLNHLLDIQRGIALERNQALLGSTVDVLVEALARTVGPTGAPGRARWRGCRRERRAAGDLRAGPVTAVTHWQLEIDAVRAAA